jgi:hypothetical protein
MRSFGALAAALVVALSVTSTCAQVRRRSGPCDPTSRASLSCAVSFSVPADARRVIKAPRG